MTRAVVLEFHPQGCTLKHPSCRRIEQEQRPTRRYQKSDNSRVTAIACNKVSKYQAGGTALLVRDAALRFSMCLHTPSLASSHSGHITQSCTGCGCRSHGARRRAAALRQKPWRAARAPCALRWLPWRTASTRCWGRCSLFLRRRRCTCQRPGGAIPSLCPSFLGPPCSTPSARCAAFCPVEIWPLVPGVLFGSLLGPRCAPFFWVLHVLPSATCAAFWPVLSGWIEAVCQADCTLRALKHPVARWTALETWLVSRWKAHDSRCSSLGRSSLGLATGSIQYWRCRSCQHGSRNLFACRTTHKRRAALHSEQQD